MNKAGDHLIMEMGRVANAALRRETTGNYEYLAFIRYCAERLNKGDSVPTIWHDYQATKT